MHAFLGGEIAFLDIAAVIEETLERLPAERVHSFDSLARADGEARRLAAELVQTLRALDQPNAALATLEAPPGAPDPRSCPSYSHSSASPS